MTEKVADWPAFKVTGRFKPLTLKPLPVGLTAETVTALPPVLVIVSEMPSVVPVVTLPKFNEVELSETAPGATPVPESETLALPPLEVTLTLPLAVPEAVGAKTTLKLADWPAFNVRGKVNPLTV